MNKFAEYNGYKIYISTTTETIHSEEYLQDVYNKTGIKHPYDNKRDVSIAFISSPKNPNNIVKLKSNPIYIEERVEKWITKDMIGKIEYQSISKLKKDWLDWLKDKERLDEKSF